MGLEFCGFPQPLQANSKFVPKITGAWGGVVVKAPRYYSDNPGIDSRWCHWIFRWHISSYRTTAMGVDSAPSENEYQERFLGVKAAVVWGWQPNPLHVPIVMKSGSLNLLEPSGAHRTCDGTALPFYYKWKHIWKESPNLWKPQIHLQTLWKIKVEFKKFRCIGGVAPL